MFTPCFINDIDPLPEPLLPILADQAAPIAVDLFDSAFAAPTRHICGWPSDFCSGFWLSVRLTALAVPRCCPCSASRCRTCLSEPEIRPPWTRRSTRSARRRPPFPLMTPPTPRPCRIWEMRCESGSSSLFNVSVYRSDALLLTGQRLTSLELPGLSRRAVLERVSDFHRALRIGSDVSADAASRRAAQAQMRVTPPQFVPCVTLVSGSGTDSFVDPSLGCRDAHYSRSPSPGSAALRSRRSRHAARSPARFGTASRTRTWQSFCR